MSAVHALTLSDVKALIHSYRVWIWATIILMSAR